MNGPAGNSEFCFPRPSIFPKADIKVEGKHNSLFPAGPVIKCLVIPPNSKLEKNWLTNLPRIQGAKPDQVRFENLCCCFPRELVSFVRPWELVSFNPPHVTRFPPIGKRI